VAVRSEGKATRARLGGGVRVLPVLNVHRAGVRSTRSLRERGTLVLVPCAQERTSCITTNKIEKFTDYVYL
jgi:hypothetical protein